MTVRIAIALTALVSGLPACGSRPAQAPVGQSAQRLTADAAAGFWRFYSVAETARPDLREPDVCRLSPADLHPALQEVDIASDLLFGPGRAVPGPMAGGEQVFCVHTAVLDRDTVAALPDVAGPIEYIPPRVSALADGVIERAAAARFASHAGLPDAGTDGEVRVAVLDSAPPGRGGLPGTGAVTPHGEDMALLVRQAVCPSNGAPVADCPAVVTGVALDLDATADGLQHRAGGGRFGDPGMLARAIHAAVDQATDDGVPLVINLSLGWLDDGDGRVSVRAVEQAIRQARDRGVVVVAAAGNDEDGRVGQGTGLMRPARWSDTLHADGEPLVVSAGALGVDGAPVANARDYGAYGGPTPSTWAYGAHAPADARFLEAGVRGPRLGGSTLWTGSSVAAAVVSASAARLMADGLDAADVIATLRGAPTPVKVCRVSGLPCPAPVSDGPDLSRLDAERAVGGRHDARAACGAPTQSPIARPDVACPSVVFENPIGLPRVDPQPSFPGCEVCAFDATSAKLVVKLSTDAEWIDLRITDMAGKVRWLTLDQGVTAGEARVYEVDPGAFKALEVSGKVTLDGKTTAFEDPVMVW